MSDNVSNHRCGPSSRSRETATASAAELAGNGFHTLAAKRLFGLHWLVSTLRGVLQKETFEEVGRPAYEHVAKPAQPMQCDQFVSPFSCSTLSVPNYHATRRKHEGWDTARMPKPRQEKSRGRVGSMGPFHVPMNPVKNPHPDECNILNGMMSTAALLRRALRNPVDRYADCRRRQYR
ncbi:hypothetical protein CLF_109819 [Clonorchis sinensis]|uniref:Uncharacterized protein n=1 Tax=Clonorchis sinensis TaxID=79923 RepID=G7YSY6_CLOSI|nr:hypothetical protein CLF_109819 [Clonorchis sinensis]